MMTKTSQPGAEPANVFEDRVTPGQWRVEWFDDDGRCELEIFSGPDARRQALRYPSSIEAGAMRWCNAALVLYAESRRSRTLL